MEVEKIIISIISYLLAFGFVLGTFWALGDRPFEVVVFLLFVVIYAQDIKNYIEKKR